MNVYQVVRWTDCSRLRDNWYWYPPHWKDQVLENMNSGIQRLQMEASRQLVSISDSTILSSRVQGDTINLLVTIHKNTLWLVKKINAEENCQFCNFSGFVSWTYTTARVLMEKYLIGIFKSKSNMLSNTDTGQPKYTLKQLSSGVTQDVWGLKRRRSVTTK